jgi:hypothetical protein
MAYTILNTDGTTLVLLADNSVDKITTSLTLVGRNVDSYGEYWNNNLVKLMANFASSSGLPPRNPLKGQLWYDTTSKRLKIYDNGFKSLNGAIVASSQPADLASGDLWFDTTNNQLNLYSSNSTYLVGPAFPKSVGKNGWDLPVNPIRDVNSNTQKVSVLYNYGSFIGLISTSSFAMSLSDSQTYFGSTTTNVVSGITVKGDVQYTGKTNNSYLPLTVDLDKITPTNADASDSAQFVIQTNTIIDILNAVYPVNTTSNTMLNPENSNSIERGVLPGSEARVFCMFSAPVIGYQLRRFIARRDISGWDYYVLDNVNLTLTNVISTNIGI